MVEIKNDYIKYDKKILSSIIKSYFNDMKKYVKTESKSLKIYNNLYNPKYSIRISTKDFGYNPDTKIKSIPLYATFLIKELTK